MKLIKSITDKCFIDSDIISESKPRRTVRTILKNEEDKIALMYMAKHKVYLFPGGGIEDGESFEEALRREVLEETGCSCRIIKELGYIYENRGALDYTQESFYYVTEKIGGQVDVKLTKDEEDNVTSYNWYSIEEAHERLLNSAHETLQQKFLQARDLAVLDEYRKYVV